MNKFLQPVRRNGIYVVIRSFLLVLVVMSGCRKDSPKVDDIDTVVFALTSMKKGDLSHEIEHRADLALSLWGNRALDPVPILVSAILAKPEGYDEIDLLLGIFDEDDDVIGIGVKEGYVHPDVVHKVLEETYPVFAHCPSSNIADMYIVPTSIRTAEQQKDLQLWQKYVSADYNDLVCEYISATDLTSEHPLDILPSVYRALLPPVWISIPEPNKVDVWVYVYDKAGNKSEAVRLLNFIDK